MTAGVLESLFSKHPAHALLSENDRLFLSRVVGTPEAVYLDRVRAVGFAGLARVLDAGCGFGQWTVPLSRLNGQVDAIDVSSPRLEMARIFSEFNGAGNVEFRAASVESPPFPVGTFDGVFSYSVLYLTDWRVSLAALYQCLAPNGILYLNTNGLGWYLLNFEENRNSVGDFNSKTMAVETLRNSIRYYACSRTIPGQSIVMPSDVVLPFLRKLGAKILASGPDGSISLDGAPSAKPFFSASEFGVESVWEVVCQKP